MLMDNACSLSVPTVHFGLKVWEQVL